MITFYVAASRNDSLSKASQACEGHGDLKSVAECIRLHGTAGDYPVANENGKNRELTPAELKEFEQYMYEA